MHDKIIITRQIVIGGRNRYLLNSHNVQQNQIQNLSLEEKNTVSKREAVRGPRSMDIATG